MYHASVWQREMMDGGKYSSGIGVSVEKIAASALVVLWITIAYLMGELPLASWAFRLFLFPLAFIWFPDLMARLTNEPGRKYGPPTAPVAAQGLRIVAWLMILGIPAAWWAFRLASTHG